MSLASQVIDIDIAEFVQAYELARAEQAKGDHYPDVVSSS